MQAIPNWLIACKDLIKVVWVLMISFKQGLICIKTCLPA
jgi:hypothetical protein